MRVADEAWSGVINLNPASFFNAAENSAHDEEFQFGWIRTD
jgi:hypothetical protein